MLPKFLEDLNPDIYRSDNYVVLDFEVDTSHGDFGRPIFQDNRLLCAAYKVGRVGKTQVRWGNEIQQAEVYETLSNADFIVAHNAIYELGWLRRGGYDIARSLCFDTQLAEYVLLGNLVSGHSDSGVPPRSISLDASAHRRGWARKDPVIDILMGHGINPASMPRKWVEDRCKQDVETTHELFKDQLAALIASNRLPVLYTRCLLTPVLADIQSEGMQLDKERVNAEYEDHQTQDATLEKELTEITGGINLRSGLQLGDYLYSKLGFSEKTGRDGQPKRTDSGRKCTDVKTLATLEAKTQEQRKFLGLHKEKSRISAALSKSLNCFKGLCEHSNGLLFADLNQTRTATHRLSSTGITTDWGSVQFQNLARAFKRLFRAKRAGWLIAEADGAGLEFRIAGHLGDDAQIRADLEDPDFDPHVTSLAEMQNVEYSQLLERYRQGDSAAKQGRTKAKAVTFKPLFGGSEGTAKERRWFKRFAERYHQLRTTQKGWVNEVLGGDHCLTTEWGLRFYFPNARISASGYCNVQNAVYNYPIQSLATAEIIPIAIVYLWHSLREAGISHLVRLVNTVHDSVVAEIHQDAVDLYRKLVKDCFTSRVYEYLARVYRLNLTVKLDVEIHIGQFWGEEE